MLHGANVTSLRRCGFRWFGQASMPDPTCIHIPLKSFAVQECFQQLRVDITRNPLWSRRRRFNYFGGCTKKGTRIVSITILTGINAALWVGANSVVFMTCLHNKRLNIVLIRPLGSARVTRPFTLNTYSGPKTALMTYPASTVLESMEEHQTEWPVIRFVTKGSNGDTNSVD